ncbi:MAG TPA: GNAT family N-acetyltransferase [Nitrososphaerales archaeon]|nr:GNAT family N-acetyltransferase [Nitrososphaerales archaeon]
MTGQIVIRELKPELAGDYLKLFDDIYDNDPWLKSSENPWWGGCYCTFYDDPREESVINASPNKRLENRESRRINIESGKATGLLAFVDERAAAWCNVAPRNSYVNPRHFKQAIEDPNERVGSLTCFVVSSRYRKSGIAPKLLQSACRLIQSWGLATAEGYPRNPELKSDNPYRIPDENLGYHGSLNMYLRSGFRVHQKFGRFLAVRKQL